MSILKPTVFVVDDDEAMRDTLSTMVDSVGVQVQVFESAQDFLDQFDRNQPGCLVLDVRMPRMSGLELQDVLTERNSLLPIIIISGHAEVSLAVRAVKAGAMDFIEKTYRPQELLDLIQSALIKNEEDLKLSQLRDVNSKRFESLTPRETEVMQLIVAGSSGKQVAAELGISYRTMEKFRANVMKKMQANSLAELVLMAVNLNIVSDRETSEQPSSQGNEATS
jgi:FixJ family two-component response regulator